MNTNRLMNILGSYGKTGSLSGAEECVLIVKRGFAAVGGPHTVEIERATMGMDWTSGKFLFRTKEPVYAGLEQMEAANRFANRVRDILYTRQHDATRNRNGNALRLIEEAMDEWLPNRSEKQDNHD